MDLRRRNDVVVFSNSESDDDEEEEEAGAGNGPTTFTLPVEKEGAGVETMARRRDLGITKEFTTRIMPTQLLPPPPPLSANARTYDIPRILMIFAICE
jgi:hypothetical protein